MLQIRRAEADDFMAVARLLTKLGRDPITEETHDPFQRVYLRYIARADTHPMVAEWDGEIVGFTSLEFRDRLNRARPEAFIPDLIVTRSARGRGIGRALLEAAISVARQHGCYNVCLDTGHHRAEGHRLYKRVGMRHAGRYYVYPLSETQARTPRPS